MLSVASLLMKTAWMSLRTGVGTRTSKSPRVESDLAESITAFSDMILSRLSSDFLRFFDTCLADVLEEHLLCVVLVCKSLYVVSPLFGSWNSSFCGQSDSIHASNNGKEDIMDGHFSLNVARCNQLVAPNMLGRRCCVERESHVRSSAQLQECSSRKSRGDHAALSHSSKESNPKEFTKGKSKSKKKHTKIKRPRSRECQTVYCELLVFKDNWQHVNLTMTMKCTAVFSAWKVSANASFSTQASGTLS
eukprot:6479489-Amphidinium_carterae.1